MKRKYTWFTAHDHELISVNKFTIILKIVDFIQRHEHIVQLCNCLHIMYLLYDMIYSYHHCKLAKFLYPTVMSLKNQTRPRRIFHKERHTCMNHASRIWITQSGDLNSTDKWDTLPSSRQGFHCAYRISRIQVKRCTWLDWHISIYRPFWPASDDGSLCSVIDKRAVNPETV